MWKHRNIEKFHSHGNLVEMAIRFLALERKAIEFRNLKATAAKKENGPKV